MSRGLDAHCSITECRSQLKNATDEVRRALSRCGKHGDKQDLERSIERFERALKIYPLGHPCRAAVKSNLVLAKIILYKVNKTCVSLDVPLALYYRALSVRPVGHPDRPSVLVHLAILYLARSEKRQDEVDTAQAEELLHHAMKLSFADSDEKWAASGMLQLCAGRKMAAVRSHAKSSMQQDSHSGFTNGDPQTLSIELWGRYQQFGHLGDLQQAITHLETLVRSTSLWDPEYPGILQNYGVALSDRFRRLGDLRDLERAILRLADAVQLTPDGHPNKPAPLNNLGNSFLVRFKRLGDLGDLEQAISRQADAVQLTLDGHRDKPALLSNLGNSFLNRFERLRELGDLERAISRQADAIRLTSDGHPNKPALLNNLGSSFRIRFQRLGCLGDLERAISRQADAVQLTLDGHPDKPGWLSNLGTSFLTRFKRLGELEDLERAISRQADAVQLTPDGHPDKPTLLNNLANSFVARFKHLADLTDLEQAISLYSHSTSYSTGPPTVRFIASVLWISCARASRHHSLLHAYSVAVGLLPQLAWSGLSLSHRYRELMQGSDVVREAAAAAVEFGYLETAVEWLEQGRSIVWGELFQLRSSYDELSAVHPDHAGRLRDLSNALEQASLTREKSLSLMPEIFHDSEHHATASLYQEADRHRALAIERDNILEEIRELPGFKRFLLLKEFSQLCASTHSGPIVILNAADSRCDALIVLAGVENVIHVPLPSFTLERCVALQTSMKGLVRDAHAIPLGERVGRRMSPDPAGQWEPILSRLWKCVVKPVMDALGFSTIQDLTRIFWCPTGPFTFLPIHAAGFYDSQYSHSVHKVFDFVVSSYVPTLSILAPSPGLCATSSNDLRFLAVRQPLSDGQFHLPGVAAELKRIREIIADSPSARVTLSESSVGTVKEVLDLMKNADWVHFACHGIQDATNPTESGLCLANNRRLQLSNIIELRRPRGGLAFLSACQTATGDKKLSDEAVHIAAGMLFAGYGGVIGTMWSISDRLAPNVAQDVYRQLFSIGTRPDYREAARALQDAVRRLRDDGASFSEWIPFIHVGL